MLAIASMAVGVIRPRWSTLLAALAPAALAFAWLIVHEDNPYDAIGPADVAWYAAMSLIVGAAFALAIAAGILTGRATRRTA